MDKVQKHNSFNTNTPSAESYKKIAIFTVAMLHVFLGLDGGFLKKQWCHMLDELQET
jgi:hypothetical protein